MSEHLVLTSECFDHEIRTLSAMHNIKQKIDKNSIPINSYLKTTNNENSLIAGHLFFFIFLISMIINDVIRILRGTLIYGKTSFDFVCSTKQRSTAAIYTSTAISAAIHRFICSIK